jgi:membrane protein YdbS with pleckstrin-like domain
MDEPERELWQGSYSPKAMAGVWLLLCLVTLGGLALGAAVVGSRTQWAAMTAAIVLAWLAALGTLLYRRLGIHYRLTSQRLFHEKGVLRRTMDRIELVRMDDISCDQGLVERLLGVGSIRIKSTDPSDPDFWIRGIENARAVLMEIDRARRAEQIRRGIFIETSAPREGR